MLKGKRVVLLGGTSGFGLSTAEAALREGAEVVVVSSRREKVDAALERLGGAAEGHTADLRDEAQIRDLFARLGALDHLAFTAGEPLEVGPLAAMSLAEARRFFDIRFWGAFAAAKYGAGSIRPGGSIVLTSGIASQRPWSGWTAAASICGAVEALTRALAVELAPIRVNAVCAGVVKTDLWGGMSEGERAAMFERAASSLPVRRVGVPSDIAQAYLYLMNSEYSTGTALVVDGGAVLV